MSPKEFLSQGRKAKDRIVILREQIDRLQDEMHRLSRATTEGSKVQSKPPRDPVGDRVSEIVDKITEREKQLALWEDKLYEVENVLNGLECVTCYKVLHARYVRGLEIWEIAEEQNYSKSYVYTLHTQGLEKIKKSRPGGRPW